MNKNNKMSPQKRLISVFFAKTLAKYYSALWLHYCFLETVARGAEHKAVLSKLSASSRTSHDSIIRIAPQLASEDSDVLVKDLKQMQSRIYLIDKRCMNKLFIRHEMKVLNHVFVLEKFLVKKIRTLKSMVDSEGVVGVGAEIEKVIDDASKRIEVLSKFTVIRKKRYLNFKTCYEMFQEVSK